MSSLETAKQFEDLLQPGDGNYIKHMHTKLEGYTSNILCVKFSTNLEVPLIVAGFAGGFIRLINYEDKKTVSELMAHKAGVISLDFHPKNSNIILSGGMDSNHHLIDISRGVILQSWTDHKKYVVRTRFIPDGTKFITASYDRTVRIYGQKDSENYTELTHFTFTGTIEALELSQDGNTLIIGSRDDNYLHFLDIDKLQETTKVNMNSNGDNFISFTPMHASYSPNGNYVLISTDKNRLILFKAGYALQARNFYGVFNDEYSQPRHCWDLTGKYIYATSQDNKIIVWDVSTQKTVASLPGHSGVVRDLVRHPTKQLLCSVSFDKSIIFWA